MDAQKSCPADSASESARGIEVNLIAGSNVAMAARDPQTDPESGSCGRWQRQAARVSSTPRTARRRWQYRRPERTKLNVVDVQIQRTRRALRAVKAFQRTLRVVLATAQMRSLREFSRRVRDPRRRSLKRYPLSGLHTILPATRVAGSNAECFLGRCVTQSKGRKAPCETTLERPSTILRTAIVRRAIYRGQGPGWTEPSAELPLLSCAAIPREQWWIE